MRYRSMADVQVRLNEVIEREGVKVVPKSKSLLMKVLSKILFFNKNFMSTYSTTIGNTVYLSDNLHRDMDRVPSRYIRLMLHELVHIVDSRDECAFAFSFRYLMPQSLALLSLLAIFGCVFPPMFFMLVFLLCLAPIPSKWRTRYETRAYVSNIIFDEMYYKVNVQDDIGWVKRNEKRIMSNFTGWSYYRMCPSEDKVAKELVRLLKKRHNKKDLIKEVPAFKLFYEITDQS